MQRCKECYNDICEHDVCVECIFELNKDHIKEGLFYGDCFYCILNGTNDIKIQCDSYDDLIYQIHGAYRIGYNDGCSGKDLPKMNCSIKELETIYRDGYDVGKKIKGLEQELADCKERFCALLPDFLAKQ